MAKMTKTTKGEDRRKQWVRVVALVLAGLMIVSAGLAALLGQLF